MPCTTILVGKNASYDGSTIVARNEDSGGTNFCPKTFRVVQPADQPCHYTSVLSHVAIDLPENPLRYTCVPNAVGDEGIWGAAGFNAANVGMSATETITNNERVLAADPLVELRAAQGEPGQEGYVPEMPGGIGEEDMVTVILPYISSARDGVRRLGELLETYGTYEMNGIAFSDVSEVWWVETLGGHHWIAKRVPDDAYVTMPNQLGIDSFDLNDAYGEQRDHMCSEDLRTWMAENHLDLTMRGDGAHFNPREAFGTLSSRDHIYNTPRAWYMQRALNPHQSWDGAGAAHTPEDDDLPWSQVPERKISIEDVKVLLSSHYEGTPFDPYGSGSAADRLRYRPIGINRTGHLAVLQLRPYAPGACRAIQWMAFGCNAFNTLTPLFANVDTTPAYLAETGAHASTNDHYWTNRIIAALADAHYQSTSSLVERYVRKTMAAGHAAVHAADKGVAALLATGNGPDEGSDAERIDATTPARAEQTAIARADDQVAAGTGMGASDAVRRALAQVNETIAQNLKAETDKLLDDVLYASSLKMRNSFTLSDH